MARAVQVALLVWAVTAQPVAGELSSLGHALVAVRPLQPAYEDRGEVAVIAAYAEAMARYRLAQGRARFVGGYPIAPVRQGRQTQSWTWATPDGSSIRRLEQGLFRVILVDHRLNWYREVDCREAGWPMFACSDGSLRKMSAPDPGTVLLDGMTFTRELPAQR